MKRYTIFTLVLLFVPFLLFAQSRITLVEDPWPPFINVDKTTQKITGGIAIQVIQKIFKRIKDVEVNFIIRPWKRALLEVKEGKFDGIPALQKTPEREKFLEYSDPLFKNRTVFFYARSRYPNGIHWNTLNDLTAYKIGVVDEHSVSTKLKKIVAEKRIKLRINKVTSDIQNFKMLLSGRIDLHPNNEAVGYSIIKKNGWQNKIIAAEKDLYSSTLHLAFSKKSEAKKLIPRINEIISELNAEGEIDNFLKSE